MDYIHLISLHDIFDIHRRLESLDIKYPQTDDCFETSFMDGNHVYMTSTWQGVDYTVKELNLFVYRNHLFSFMLSGDHLTADALITGDYLIKAKNTASTDSVERIRFALNNMFDGFPTDEFMSEGLNIPDIEEFLEHEAPPSVFFVKDIVTDLPSDHDAASPYNFYWAFKSAMTFLGRDLGSSETFMVLSLPFDPNKQTSKACIKLLKENYRFKVSDTAAGGFI